MGNDGAEIIDNPSDRRTLEGTTPSTADSEMVGEGVGWSDTVGEGVGKGLMAPDMCADERVLDEGEARESSGDALRGLAHLAADAAGLSLRAQLLRIWSDRI